MTEDEISHARADVHRSPRRALGRNALDKPQPPPYKPPSAALMRFGAQVAQLVEHATENRSVGGSIPPLGTIAPPRVVTLRRARMFDVAREPLA